MRLFVFEGETEKRHFDTLKLLFFKQQEDDVCIYRSNIYSLYSKMKEYDVFGGDYADTVSVLHEILMEKGDNSLSPIIESGNTVSEIFLFFDYDFHDKHIALEEINKRLSEMLNFFCEETENGKLYINYPMAESYRYVKSLTDANFVSYNVTREESHDFKRLVSAFSPFSIEHFALSEQELRNAGKAAKRLPPIKANWIALIPLNVCKANFLCNGINEIPTDKDSINQQRVFNSQLTQFVSQEPCRVSVLSSFPLFLFEYLKAESLSTL